MWYTFNYINRQVCMAYVLDGMTVREVVWDGMTSSYMRVMGGLKSDHGSAWYFLRSSSETFLSESSAVAFRSILYGQACSRSDELPHQLTWAPLPDPASRMPSWPPSTARRRDTTGSLHADRGSQDAASSSRFLVVSICGYRGSAGKGETHTPVLREVQKLIGDYCTDKMLSRVLVRSPAVSISEEASRVGRM